MTVIKGLHRNDNLQVFWHLLYRTQVKNTIPWNYCLLILMTFLQLSSLATKGTWRYFKVYCYSNLLSSFERLLLYSHCSFIAMTVTKGLHRNDNLQVFCHLLYRVRLRGQNRHKAKLIILVFQIIGKDCHMAFDHFGQNNLLQFIKVFFLGSGYKYYIFIAITEM